MCSGTISWLCSEAKNCGRVWEHGSAPAVSFRNFAMAVARTLLSSGGYTLAPCVLKWPQLSWPMRVMCLTLWLHLPVRPLDNAICRNKGRRMVSTVVGFLPIHPYRHWSIVVICVQESLESHLVIFHAHMELGLLLFFQTGKLGCSMKAQHPFIAAHKAKSRIANTRAVPVSTWSHCFGVKLWNPHGKSYDLRGGGPLPPVEQLWTFHTGAPPQIQLPNRHASSSSRIELSALTASLSGPWLSKCRWTHNGSPGPQWTMIRVAVANHAPSCSHWKDAEIFWPEGWSERTALKAVHLETLPWLPHVVLHWNFPRMQVSCHHVKDRAALDTTGPVRQSSAQSHVPHCPSWNSIFATYLAHLWSLVEAV